MKRYVAIPRAEWVWSDSSAVKTGQTVHEVDNPPRDTGLLDTNGVKLYSIEDKMPIGFVTR